MSLRQESRRFEDRNTVYDMFLASMSLFLDTDRDSFTVWLFETLWMFVYFRKRDCKP